MVGSQRRDSSKGKVKKREKHAVEMTSPSPLRKRQRERRWAGGYEKTTTEDIGFPSFDACVWVRVRLSFSLSVCAWLCSHSNIYNFDQISLRRSLN